MPKKEAVVAPTDLDELNDFIPRPARDGKKRHMIAIDADSYDYISETAERLTTTRGRVITALVSFYRDGA
jgi:hypothetical protein